MSESPASSEFTEDEKEILAYLSRSKRVDLRWLSGEEKLKIRTVLDGLHNGRKISLLRISREIGRSYTAIWGLCRALEIHTRSVAEADKESAAARSKHKRTMFDGTEEDRAYMVGFKNGDLTAWQVSGTAVMVSSTTTHPAFVKLFRELFEGYGHVYEYPMYEEGKGYKWKVAVRLDNSFRFLLTQATDAAELFAPSRKIYVSWLAGLVDSDGNIHVSENKGTIRVRVVLYNNDTALLKAIVEQARAMGYEFDGPYLMKRQGEVTPFGIRYTEDLWDIAIQQTESAKELLRELPLRHAERIERKARALSVGEETWQQISAKLEDLKKRIHIEVEDFLREAETRYLLGNQKKRRGVTRKEGSSPNC